ncbi:hypothetical protein BpHYR1_013653 [Brachionus plicatilis]|uniref:Uncharacterized protein n=1 Tax=Brachionus plicatilis TaxID=10195 RepID=A0A3M7SXM1_BRAPC|nr:hypothetical protein BpHYR1_013653 [Brachionus plicatilis]
MISKLSMFSFAKTYLNNIKANYASILEDLKCFMLSRPYSLTKTILNYIIIHYVFFFFLRVLPNSDNHKLLFKIEFIFLLNLFENIDILFAERRHDVIIEILSHICCE